MRINKDNFSQRTVIVGLSIILVGIIILFWLLSRTLLIIEIQPSGASLFMDNSPVTLKADGKVKKMVKAGEHEIRVEAEDFISYNKTLTLPKAGSQRLNVKLMRRPNLIALSEAEKNIGNIDLIHYDEVGEVLYYFADNRSKLYQAKIDLNAEGTVYAKQNHLIAEGLSGILETIWSPKNDAIFLKKADGFHFLDLRKLDLVSQKEYKYGSNIGDLAWSPDDSKIAYYFFGNNEQSLIFADKRNQNIERVLNLRENGITNPYLSWSPNSEWLILIPRNEDKSTNKIYLFNAYTRKLSVTNESGYNLEAKFQSDGSRIIYSTFSKNPGARTSSIISMMNPDGQNQKTTELRSLLSQTRWLGGDNLLSVYYNLEKGVEEIAVFDVATKKINGATFTLPGKVYVGEIINTKNSIAVFTINENLYGMSLK